MTTLERQLQTGGLDERQAADALTLLRAGEIPNAAKITTDNRGTWLEWPKGQGSVTRMALTFEASADRFAAALGTAAIVSPSSPTPSPQRRSVKTTPARTARATKPSERIRTVAIDRRARKQILGADLGAWAEVSGGVWGDDGADGCVVVTLANEAHHRDESFKYSSAVDFGLIDLVTERVAARGDRWLGTWHSEPSIGRATPSPADITHWRSCARYTGQDAVGLIIRRAFDDTDEAWLSPAWTGFVVPADESRSPRTVDVILEPTEVELEYGDGSALRAYRDAVLGQGWWKL